MENNITLIQSYDEIKPGDLIVRYSQWDGYRGNYISQYLIPKSEGSLLLVAGYRDNGEHHILWEDKNRKVTILASLEEIPSRSWHRITRPGKPHLMGGNYLYGLVIPRSIQDYIYREHFKTLLGKRGFQLD